MIETEKEQWREPFTHILGGEQAFLDAHREHVLWLLDQYVQFGPMNQEEAVTALVRSVYRYGQSQVNPTVEDHRKNLRRVTFSRYVITANTCAENAWVNFEGWFHRWADTYEEFAAGAAQYTMALVEAEDGRPYFVHPEKLQFHVPTPTLP